MGNEKLHLTKETRLTKEKETLLITLYGRAVHSRSEDPVLRDPLAEQAVERLDYDFHKLKMRSTDALGVAIRAKTLDTITAAHLPPTPDATAPHSDTAPETTTQLDTAAPKTTAARIDKAPDPTAAHLDTATGTTVVHLACGLDTRVYRLDPPPTVRWFDVDFPEIIALRERLFPPRPGYTMIGLPATDPGWMEPVPADGPVLVVAEGLMMYLTPGEVDALLRGITGRFPSGDIVFDAISHLAVKLSRFQPQLRATGATLHWGLDDPAELTAANPRLHLVSELFFSDVPEVERFPAGYRAALAVMNRFYFLRRIGRILHYRF
ncbi:class I SAM-dependent methyltransferase [Sphaerisporangium corydalis]|uniref:Class I SAM-dependent methyltransferase n=1 Tax=Sphaerisporangium corydalis TaxID=1441875 RepID=A0ABV9E9V9_9ACTN|nr:class I SAM-dependent methyltransferase [Sphaerisporangium corydalis]